MSTPIRVFIGTEPKTEIARQVLQFSIREHTDARVEFTSLIGPEWEYPLDGITVGTGFSLRRWMIPAACGWKGRAVYLDADQLVFGDVAELWAKPDGPPGLKLTPDHRRSAWLTYQPDKFSKTPWPQTSVMVIDCAAAEAEWGWHLDQVLARLRADPTKQAYANFMHMTWAAVPPGCFEDGWNHLNVFTPNTRLLHYTKEPEQPWYKPGHPLSKVWEAAAVRAVRAGAVDRKTVEAGLAAWGKQEDWRTANGLHPYWSKLLDSFPT